MITRTWWGVTRAGDADAYLDYLRRTGLQALRETGGNRGVACLRRIVGEEAEFVVVSLWESREAIAAFAGEDIEKAVFYPEDEAYLIDRELSCAHWDVVYRNGAESEARAG
jgi:heme-degrading monooxygenase HmoA